MAEREYTKNIKSGDFAGRSATVTYDFGDNLQEAVEKFGEGVVFSNFHQQAAISIQGVIARCIKSGKDPQETVNGWKLGMAKPRKGKVEKVSESIEEIESLDELKAIQERIKERASALRG